MIIFNFDVTFFENLIDDLNTNQINYCIVGDYSSLPETINHDIDFCTDNISLFHTVLQRVAKQLNFRVFIDNHTIHGFNFAFYKRCDENFLFMKIDVFKETLYKSLITLIDSDTIRDNRLPIKKFFVSNKESEATMHFLYPLLEWGKIKKNGI